MTAALPQYPGVAQSIQSDVQNLLSLLKMSVALPEGEAPTPPLPAGRGPRREEVGLDGGRVASSGQGVPVCECMCKCVFETERRDTDVGRAQGVQACEKKTNLEILTNAERQKPRPKSRNTHTVCRQGL